MTLFNLLRTRHKLTAKWIKARGLLPKAPPLPVPKRSADCFRPTGKVRRKAVKALPGLRRHGHRADCDCNRDKAAMKELLEYDDPYNGVRLGKTIPPLPGPKIDCPAAWRLPRQVTCEGCGVTWDLTQPGREPHLYGCGVMVERLNNGAGRRRGKMSLEWRGPVDGQKELVLKPPAPPGWPLNYPKLNRGRQAKLRRALRYYARARK